MTVEAGGFRTDLAGRSLVQPETPIAEVMGGAAQRGAPPLGAARTRRGG